MSYLTSLIASPWALRRELMPQLAYVLGRLARGEPMSDEDRRAVEEGKAAAATRRQQSAQYAGNGAIAVIPVIGVLTQRGDFADVSTPTTSMTRLTAAVNAAAADPAIAAIVLDVDSPGGSVYGVTELADAIYQARQAKPIAAVANSLAASAAYWCACQAGELYASPGAEVGSIGCYTMHADVSEAMKQRGISVELISAGKYKTEASSYAPLSDDARAHVQAGVDAYYDAFVTAVARGRKTTQKAVRGGMGEGRVLQPYEAARAGMIDGVATLAQVIGKMQARLKRTGSSASQLAKHPARATVAHRLMLEYQQEDMATLRAAPASAATAPPTKSRPLTRAQMERELAVLENL
jgi:signal peptide peptidase SppA